MGLTEERDTPSSTSAREKDAQTARIRPAPSFKTFSTELERTTARIATLITLPAKDTTEKKEAVAEATMTTPTKKGRKSKTAEEKASEVAKSPGAGRGRKRKVTEESQAAPG